MTGSEDRLGSGRGPLLWGVVAVLVGVVGAVLLGVTLGGEGSPIAAVSSPSASIPDGSPSQPAGPSPSTPGPSESSSAGESPTNAPATLLPTTLPSVPPTAAPTATPTPTPTPTPRATPRPTPTPNTNPTITSFKVPKNEDCTGGSAGTITISWSIERATGVTISIDGPGIFDSYPGTSGSTELPFGCSRDQLAHTYTLTTTGGSGPAASSTKTVTATAPSIKTFSLGPANCPSEDGSIGISLTYEIVAATGAELTRDGDPYTTYSQKTSSNGLNVVYECSKSSQTFVLTTTGGYGTEATKTVVVKRSLP